MEWQWPFRLFSSPLRPLRSLRTNKNTEVQFPADSGPMAQDPTELDGTGERAGEVRSVGQKGAIAVLHPTPVKAGYSFNPPATSPDGAAVDII